MRESWSNQANEPFEETLVPPRFDERATLGARRVVPITGEAEEVTRTAVRTSDKPWMSTLTSFPKLSWPLALIITFGLVAAIAGAVTIHRSLSSTSQNQETVAVPSSTVSAGESDEDASSRSVEKTGRTSRARAERRNDQTDDDVGRPVWKAWPEEGHGEDREKDNKGEGRGEDKRRDKEDKWREREKEREKEKRGKDGDEYRKRFERAERDLSRIREFRKGKKD